MTIVNDITYFHYFNYPQYPVFYYPNDFNPSAYDQYFYSNTVPMVGHTNCNSYSNNIYKAPASNLRIHVEDINNPSVEPCEVTTPRRYDTEESPSVRLDMYRPVDSVELPQVFEETNLPTNIHRFDDPVG
ncbi:hypothetical protein MXB_4760 [Myxobolus squamalis]|nr:hypothetical protein MXB_4760 [Myxobolus squamalis]